LDTQLRLAERFAFGSNLNRLSGTWGGEQAFFIEMPRNVEGLRRVNGEILESLERANDELGAQGRERRSAFGEITRQIDDIRDTLAGGFDEVSTAILRLEDVMAYQLSEIRMVLGQIDDHLGALVRLVKFPRETEAAELVGDGLKAMIAGNWDDAEACFTSAIQRKRTHFQAHANLAFVYLRLGMGDAAVNHFQKACDYVPDECEPQVKHLAHKNLARALFATYKYEKAVAAIERSIAMLERPEDVDPQTRYAYVVYLALAGSTVKAMTELRLLCNNHPRFFAIAYIDKDLEPLRVHVVDVLDDLASEECRLAKADLGETRHQLARVVGALSGRDPNRVEEEIAFLTKPLADCDDLVSSGEFTLARNARAICRAGTKLIAALEHLAQARCRIALAAEKEAELMHESETLSGMLDPIAVAFAGKRERHQQLQERFRMAREELPFGPHALGVVAGCVVGLVIGARSSLGQALVGGICGGAVGGIVVWIARLGNFFGWIGMLRKPPELEEGEARLSEIAGSVQRLRSERERATEELRVTRRMLDKDLRVLSRGQKIPF
jgi:tetratricopeptide (TPR) repeat protein